MAYDWLYITGSNVSSSLENVEHHHVKALKTAAIHICSLAIINRSAHIIRVIFYKLINTNEYGTSLYRAAYYHLKNYNSLK